MTTLAQRPASLTGAATLRTLAGLEARRYALHPLFLVGVALLGAVTIANSDNLDAAAGIETLLPAFLLGLLGVFVGHQLTRSIAPSTEAVEAAPADGVTRTGALCLACLVPGAVAVVWVASMYLAMAASHFPDSAAISPAGRAGRLGAAVAAAVGGPLFGVMVRRWPPPRTRPGSRCDPAGRRPCSGPGRVRPGRDDPRRLRRLRRRRATLGVCPPGAGRAGRRCGRLVKDVC